MGCDGVFSRGSLVSSERNAFKTELPDAETPFCFYQSESEQLKQPACRLLLGPGDRHFFSLSLTCSSPIIDCPTSAGCLPPTKSEEQALTSHLSLPHSF